ncbi:MAG: hypothetical protein ACI9MC_000182 [Kiritimatiellia bacterium]|jgi:hypothetical protein
MFLLSALLTLSFADGTSCRSASDVACLQRSQLHASTLLQRAEVAEASELVDLADRSGLDEVVAELLDRGGHGSLDTRAVALFMLARGRHSVSVGDWSGAVDPLRAVPFDGGRWFEARLLLAEALHELGRGAEAVHAARDVLVPPDGRRAPSSLPWDPDPALRARAMAQIAVVYQDLGDRRTSESFWRSTSLHPRVQAERWVGLASTVESDGEALGLRVTLADPELAERVWDPGAPVAWARALASRCRVREAGLQRSMAIRRNEGVVSALRSARGALVVDLTALASIDGGLVGWLKDRPRVRRASLQLDRLNREMLTAPASLRVALAEQVVAAGARRQVALREALGVALRRTQTAYTASVELDVAGVAPRIEVRPMWARGLPSRFHGEYWPDERGRHYVRLRDDCVHRGRDVLLVYP